MKRNSKRAHPKGGLGIESVGERRGDQKADQLYLDGDASVVPDVAVFRTPLHVAQQLEH